MQSTQQPEHSLTLGKQGRMPRFPCSSLPIQPPSRLDGGSADGKFAMVQSVGGKSGTVFSYWNETMGSDGQLREPYKSLIGSLDALPLKKLRALDQRLEATMREMGVTFDIVRDRPWGRRPWVCDLLPQIFLADEWDLIERGVRQRMEAYEAFLRDIYGGREILRSGTLPVQPVMGSPYFQRVATGLPLPGGHFLHLSGLAVCRMTGGELAVKHHYFSNASGISYMIQNRRALARVIPGNFGDLPIASIAEVPTIVLEGLRRLAEKEEPLVVLLSSGSGSAVYSEHAFLARRMGIPLVVGGDLLVLDDSVYLKTVTGLEKVDVIYSRLADDWLDPIAFRRDSLIGVPGLVNCIRQGKVVVANAIGSQLADDRALLPFAARIIRYYTGESPILPQVPTYWLGEIDQREMVLDRLEEFTVRPLYGEKILLGGDGKRPGKRDLEEARREILANAPAYVAQPQACDAVAPTYHDGKKRECRQDHIFFATLENGKITVFPGALTRTTTADCPYTSSELGGGSKDTWVEIPQHVRWPEHLKAPEVILPEAFVGSRVAEAFYWMGRYLERAVSLAGMIRVIEALELEELNPTERALYRPVWNKILPPLGSPGDVTRRTISSPSGRQRLTLDLSEPDSVASTVSRAIWNAESVFECLSLEVWSVLDALRGIFRVTRTKRSEAGAHTRMVCEEVCARVPQFFGTAEATMVADGTLAFCSSGQHLERAIITVNALHSFLQGSGPHALVKESGEDTEIRLAAFLRLLSSRDLYRRVYQMRIETGAMLDLLMKNPLVPRSAYRCLRQCSRLLREARDAVSPATQRAIGVIDGVAEELRATDWFHLKGLEEAADRCGYFLEKLLALHYVVTDGFLNHQIHIRDKAQPTLQGTYHAV